jgi:hypothetical protein
MFHRQIQKGRWQTMTKKIARLLQQFHAVFGFLALALLPRNRSKTVEKILNEVPKTERYSGAIWGFAALSFVQTYDCVYKELGKPATMTATVDRAKLGVTVNTRDKDNGESDDEACLRHLRNSFAHGHFTISVSGKTTTVLLEDRDRSKITFTAKCGANVIVKHAEKLLVAAQKEAAAVALLVASGEETGN